MPESSLISCWVQREGFFRDDRLSGAGIVHGVTTRGLGDMGDGPSCAAALKAAGLEGRRPLFLKQMHGAGVLLATRSAAQEPRPLADGWITQEAGVVPCVFVADCAPLFLWHRSGKAAGIFHAGWRGMEAGMPRRAVKAFEENFGIKPADLLASIGPRIRACCYRVGPEMRGKFRAASLVEREEGLYLDLGAEARAQLRESGLAAESVAESPACTSCSTGLFYSFRRDKQDQRMMAFLSLP